MNKNRVELEGFLGNEPELRRLPSGEAVTNMRLATTDYWQDKGGARKSHTEWHSLVIYGPLAELAAKHWRKGDNIAAEGRIQSRTFGEDNKKVAREIIVFRAHRIDRLPGADRTEEAADEAATGSADNWPKV